MSEASETRATESKKVWTTLITNTAYLPGLLALEYSLKKQGSKYPLVALYTDTFPPEGHKALDNRKIAKQHVKYLMPSVQKDFTNDPRFYDCWSKLTPFSLTKYERVVQLDSDMLVFRNMDELMDLELDPPGMRGDGVRVFAASHACVCNPLKKPHYPKNWTPENCAFTTQHSHPEEAQTKGAPPTAGLGMPNGGLQVVNPSEAIYNKIVDHLASDSTMNFDFADQSLLSDLFGGRWIALPYVYNALKTLRDIHKPIWRDDEVKNMHYLLTPNPWDEEEGKETQETFKWWWKLNRERLDLEKENGIADGF
ncbi:uncharacterized protein KY384_008241 [Bacidia gigantensis]|uniref:uncharacterized protein n=1 Tax=Bacidia gigantensis TaxID=2732470 RepID=UPI001D044A66|nr:uncharacterized protein KY384_008241 [Bacidia gigantensis]KAG8526812.1 hypothetical protein KY384_008241 [Bacidia gigantensis]